MVVMTDLMTTVLVDVSVVSLENMHKIGKKILLANSQCLYTSIEYILRYIK